MKNKSMMTKVKNTMSANLILNQQPLFLESFSGLFFSICSNTTSIRGDAIHFHLSIAFKFKLMNEETKNMFCV